MNSVPSVSTLNSNILSTKVVGVDMVPNEKHSNKTSAPKATCHRGAQNVVRVIITFNGRNIFPLSEHVKL